MTSYQVCTFCVMDTTDVDLQFDDEGRCNLCRVLEASRGTSWFVDDTGIPQLEKMLDRIKSAGKGKEFDSILGLSGGVDSSYLALKAHDWGLRPLVMHVDAGWNSELAVANIQTILDHTGWELHTRVINWEDMRDLQLSYLRAGVANQDVPQDHAFFASLYHFATENDVRTILNGGNSATEGIFASSWHHSAMDARNLKAIHAEFGSRKLHDYPTIGFAQYYVWYPLVKRMTPARPLNFLPYHKGNAVEELSQRIGYRPYERKHGESLFTKFFQNYYLPMRFGYDKRKQHLSSQIVSGEYTREEALDLLSQPLYDEPELRRDTAYLRKKLRVSEDEWEELMNAPRRSALEFANWNRQFDRVKAVQSAVAKLTGKRLRIYS